MAPRVQLHATLSISRNSKFISRNSNFISRNSKIISRNAEITSRYFWFISHTSKTISRNSKFISRNSKFHFTQIQILFHATPFLGLVWGLYIWVSIKWSRKLSNLITRTITILQHMLQNYFCACDHNFFWITLWLIDK